MATRKPERAGFTLVEVLIVLAIVTILAAILLTVFSRVREKGRSAVCQSNLKQISLAALQYTQDYDGRFPPITHSLTRDAPTAKEFWWTDAIMPYVKNNKVFECPSNRESTRPMGDTTYGYNSVQLNDLVLSADGDPKKNRFAGSHESKVVSTSTVLLASDMTWEDEGSNRHGTLVETSCGPVRLGVLHSGGVNVSFVDGHVKWFSLAQQSEMFCAIAAEELNAPR